MSKKEKNIFVQGAIPPEKIADSIAKHQVKTQIGAHDIFLGQVRADVIEDKTVVAIEYTAYEEMALQVCGEIRESTFSKFPITCMHIYHSLGLVKSGELCLFVFVSAPHRKTAFEALHFVVEAIKDQLPVFGKELFNTDEYQWKVNN